jgi:Ca2+-binding EF-hand superfamily protein
MRHDVLRIAVAAGLATFASTLSYGLEGDDHLNPLTPELLQQADTNHNGQVTFLELKAVLPLLTENLFHEWDKNEPFGVLTPADLPPPPGPGGDDNLFDLLLHLLNDADSNENQEVTFAEAHALMPGLTEEIFFKLDLNHDNVLTGDDLPEENPDNPIERFLHLLNDADANDDGEVTFDEAVAFDPEFSENRFNELDHNDDGVLSEEDLPPPPVSDNFDRLLHLIEEADADNSGGATLQEIRAIKPDFPEEEFNKLDLNDDGVLSPEDIPPHEGDDPIERLLDILHELDANGDGEVTLEEIHAALPEFTQEMFDRLDFNDDGVLSVADLPAPDPDDEIERLIELLHNADANGDGEVTLEELRQILPDFPEDAFNRLDRNDDGVLSREDLPDEVPAGPCERLKELLHIADADGNHEVTFEELKAVLPELTEEGFNRLDANNDNVLSEADLPPFPCDPIESLLRLLEHADADQNGQVTFEELLALLPDLTQEQFDRMDRNEDGVLTEDDAPEPPLDPIARLIRLLHDADANEDGQVTFEELQAVAPELTEERFNELDKNDDNVITGEDLPEHHGPDDYIRHLLEEADADENSEVTFEELQAVLPELTQEQFDRLDQNGDGVISEDDKPDDSLPPTDDLREALLRALVRADTNHDGALDFAEIADAFPDAPSALLAEIDTNDDWIITRDEILAALGESLDGRELIESHDVDGDGETNAVDVQNCINQALDIFGNLLPVDLDGDDSVGATDIQGVINGALGL